MKKLSAEETKAISRISSLVLVNAMIFQEILSKHREFSVAPLEKVLNEENVLSRV